MKIKLLIVVCLLMSGCALTDMAKDVLTDWQDTNRYEAARQVASDVCTPDVLDRLDRFLGADAVAVVRKKCDDL